MTPDERRAALTWSVGTPAARRFVDQIAVVTGGASGLGRAAAERFAAEGATQYKAASSTYGSWRSGVLVALGSFLGWDQLLCNAGALDHVSLEPTPGTLSVATYPAATTGVGGNNAAVYLSAYTVSKMLMSGPPELRQRADAAGGQAIPSFWFGAGNDRNGRFVVQPPGDVVAGALGAFPDRDRVDIGGAWWWPNNPSGNAEEWEDALPVIYLYRRERQGSGGAGRWRGPNSLETAMLLHKTDEMMVQLISLDNAINCAVGMGGGLPAHPGDYRFAADSLSSAQMASGVLPGSPDQLTRQVGPLTRMFAKEITVMAPGDVFVAQYCGGGFGDPLVRGPEHVLQDVASGAITTADARSLYGVVLADGGLDAEGTAALRIDTRTGRLRDAQSPAAPDSARLDLGAAVGEAVGTMVFGPGPDGQLHWGCQECGQGLGRLDENPKRGAARLERLPQDVNPGQYLDPALFCDAAFVVRQFLCPECGVTLSTEMCRPEDPPVLDVHMASPEEVAS